MTECIMIQGTMSGVGKSVLTTALCRIFHQDGLRVAPFKSQNMALNSYITADGLEMGRAQAVQAQAAGKLPDVRMNPILLKPSSDVGSQLIVGGKVKGDYQASVYFSMKKELIPEILDSYYSLADENDIIVLEGAGSPAEINLKSDDIVNMGLAKLVNAPVLLVGDIDRGGVFAQLYGTVSLLDPEERRRIFGFVINKFRGDKSLLTSGLDFLERKCAIPVLGVIPFTRADIDDEDSLSHRLEQTQHSRLIDVAILRLPHISNFTDFGPLERHPALGVRYVSTTEELDKADLVLIPGTKNTMGDLSWMRQNGLEDAVKRLAAADIPVIGICGGYQMLGAKMYDPKGVENGGDMDGMGLLPCETVFEAKKIRTQVSAIVKNGPFRGVSLKGYEIHMGRTESTAVPFCSFKDGESDGSIQGNIFGTYLHGLFDTGELTDSLANWLLKRKGISQFNIKTENQFDYQDQQIDQLANIVRVHLNMDAIYSAMEEFANG